MRGPPTRPGLTSRYRRGVSIPEARGSRADREVGSSRPAVGAQEIVEVAVGRIGNRARQNTRASYERCDEGHRGDDDSIPSFHYLPF